MDNKKNGIPKLRFPGFTGAWEQRKLGEVFEIQSGFTGASQLNNGKFKISRIETISNGVIDSKKIGFSNTAPNKKYKLKVGDILYSNINSIEHIGKIAEYTEDIGLYHGINLLRLSSVNENSSFLFYELNTENKKNWAKSHANKAVNQASINQTELKKQRLDIPSIEEQNLISNFLIQFDSLITLHQRKLEHLQEQKKGLLQKMFPKNGEVVPEVRFPGFTDAWEQRKLGDYLSIPTKEPITDINELKLMTLKLNLEGITLTANRETLKLGATKYYKRHEGQLLYGKQNFFHGSIALISKEAEGYATSGDVPALDISNVNGKYLVDYISRPSYFKAKEALATGTGSKRIHEKTLLNFKITVPSLEEQNAISDFITNYTNLITLHQRKLEHLELMKKGLLQQMFV